jgi:hypothetical protein
MKMNVIENDETYIVEGSPNLTFREPLDINPGNVGETVTVEPPSSGGRGFLRLGVISSTPEVH